MLNPKRQRFVDEYLKCRDGAAAARRAGYSEKTAKEQAYQMLHNDPEVIAAIQEAQRKEAMALEEAISRMSDIARTRLNDYFIIKQVEQTRKVDKPLAEVIAALQDEMEFEEEFAQEAALSDDELSAHHKEQKRRGREILRLQVELRRNPDATKKVSVTELVEEAELDLVALTRDKKLGLIEGFEFDKFGRPKVKLAAPSASIDKIIQLHGGYKQMPGDAGGEKTTNVYILPDGTKIEF